MKWFRFYHEVYRDPKAYELRPELFRFWINFQCVASESETLWGGRQRRTPKARLAAPVKL